MAKRAAETNLPLVISLVFFVLATIGLGVFTYVLYSDQAAKDQEVKKAADEKKAASTVAKRNELRLKMYQIAVGTNTDKADLEEFGRLTGEDAEAVRKEHEAFSKAAENMVSTAALAQKGAAPPNAGLFDWKPAADGKFSTAPTRTVITGVVTAYGARNQAVTDMGLAKKSYDDQVVSMKKAIDNLEAETAKFATATKDVQPKIAAAAKNFEDAIAKAKADYEATTKGFRTKLDGLADEGAKKDVELEKRNKQIAALGDDLRSTRERLPKQDTFRYDEPQGKILRVLPESLVEIDLGSADRVRPGLTFTVLPTDFPSRGYQSRVREVRVFDDETRQYKSVERFVPKGTLEVVEVLGPNVSKARLSATSEIRDAVLPGDLLYNVVWRKGYSEHIALLGIFDTNGDGSDDISAVVRDLTNMGVVVDAYFDLAKRQWVGKVTEQTRFVVEGYLPNPRESDPNLKAKTDLIGAINKARDEATNKGVSKVSFRDFFPRTGYKVKLDVTDDRINQATSRYIIGVASIEEKKAE